MAVWVGIAVVAVRFVAPLFILRFPLPAILVCLVADAVDQTVFQAVTDDPLEWYQSYDKALDIFYLGIAYISTIRTWQDERAYQVARGLFYWRLVGTFLFELTGWRFLLLLFPNAFEYFFIAYEAIRTRWDPRRLTAFAVVGLAAAITLVIKVPQETWIHVLKLDVTDVLGDNRWLIGVVVGVLLAVAVRFRRFLRSAPPPDWERTFDARTHQPERPALGLYLGKLVDSALIEKVVFLALVGFVLANMLPELETTWWHVVLTVSLLVVLNTAVTEWWRRRRGRGWSTTLREFAAVVVINLGIIGFLPDFLLRDGLPDQDPLFFVLLISLLSTLFDRAIDTRPPVEPRPRAWREALDEWRGRRELRVAA